MCSTAFSMQFINKKKQYRAGSCVLIPDYPKDIFPIYGTIGFLHWDSLRVQSQANTAL